MDEQNLVIADLNTVAYLRYLGFKYCEVPQYIDGRVVFFFKPTSEAKAAIENFQNGQVDLNPKVFFQIRKNLKRSIDAAVKEALSDALTQKRKGGPEE